MRCYSNHLGQKVDHDFSYSHFNTLRLQHLSKTKYSNFGGIKIILESCATPERAEHSLDQGREYLQVYAKHKGPGTSEV